MNKVYVAAQDGKLRQVDIDRLKTGVADTVGSHGAFDRELSGFSVTPVDFCEDDGLFLFRPVEWREPPAPPRSVSLTDAGTSGSKGS